MIILSAVMFLSSAAAEPSVTKDQATPPRRHLVYAEALGKAGPYGVGWELAITPRLSLGVAGSFAMLGGQQLYTIAPYLHAAALRGGRHTLFGELGLVVIHSHLPSPVAEWDGMSDTGAGGQATLGWQWQPGRWVVRTSGGIAAGQHGIAPIVGLALGITL